MILPWTVGKTCELPRLSAGPRSPWVIYSHDIPMRDISVIYGADIPSNQHVSCLNSCSNTSTPSAQILTWEIPMISKFTFQVIVFIHANAMFRHTIPIFRFRFSAECATPCTTPSPHRQDVDTGDTAELQKSCARSPVMDDWDRKM